VAPDADSEDQRSGLMTECHTRRPHQALSVLELTSNFQATSLSPSFFHQMFFGQHFPLCSGGIRLMFIWAL